MPASPSESAAITLRGGALASGSAPGAAQFAAVHTSAVPSAPDLSHDTAIDERFPFAGMQSSSSAFAPPHAACAVTMRAGYRRQPRAVACLGSAHFAARHEHRDDALG